MRAFRFYPLPKHGIDFSVIVHVAISKSFGQDTLRMSTVGLATNSRINTVPFINKALAQTNNKSTVILFDKGRYDFWADHCTEKNYYEANTTILNPRICPLFIFKKQNIIIDGNGAEFIFHGRMQPFTVDSSTNIINFLAQYTENISYKNVHCIPNPAKRKVLAGHDDGLHHTNCKGLITIDGCSFKGIMDDAVNFHNTYVLVDEKLSSTKLRCKFKHHQSLGFIWGRKGEEVGFLRTETMNTVAKAIIKSYTVLAPELLEIEFETPVPEAISVGDALENLTWNPSVEVKNSYFGQHRARAILVSTAGKVAIHHNTFESSGAAICIPGDANQWYEGGAVTDVTITNNIFRNCNSSAYQFSEGIISVQPGIPNVDLALPAFHRNIRVSENTFEVFDATLLYVVNVDGFTFSNNIIKNSTRYKPRFAEKPTFTFDACFNVRVVGNRIESRVLGKSIQILRTKKSELKVDRKQDLRF